MKIFSPYYAARNFFTLFTSARYLCLNLAILIQLWHFFYFFKSCFNVLHCHWCRGLTVSLFPSCFPTKTQHVFHYFLIRATRPVYFNLLDFIIRKTFLWAAISENMSTVWLGSALKARPGFTHTEQHVSEIILFL